MHRAFCRAGGLVLVVALAACQRYDWVYQPKTDRQGLHFTFTVQTPSKADVVFVIDNSDSMYEKQLALRDSLESLLTTLAPNDTSYRIGIVSTDTIGWTTDCSGYPYVFRPEWLPTTLDRCDKPSVVLRRPHDGAFGRLMAAYSPEWFDPDNTAYDSVLRGTGVAADVIARRRAAFLKLVPTSAEVGPRDASNKPTSVTGSEGVPWVIDRDIVRTDACKACDSCDCAAPEYKKSECYMNCVAPVSQAIVRAFFSSNIEGLGIYGSGWEQGVRASLLAVGINSDLSIDRAVDYGESTMKSGGPNTFTVLDANGKPVKGARWLRDEAILGVMYVSDEQDCSMPANAFPALHALEEPRNQPVGSGCYQSDGLAILTDTTRVVSLLKERKGKSSSRLALGFIGGVEPSAVGDYQYGSGVAHDCHVAPVGSTSATTPSYSCQCLASQATDQRWCSYSQNLPPVSSDKCDALAGSRYVDIANAFRHTYDSICQSNYGGALSEFAKRLISACFELDFKAEPAGDDPTNIQVVRTAKSESESAPPTTQAYLGACTNPSAGTGWCYMAADVSDPANPQKPQVCLQGYDRLIGDVYDIFVLTTNKYDPSN
jgi:hypothetical protein